MRGDDDYVADYMVWWISDFRRDTGDLDCLEHGAYRQLLEELWVHGGYLPYNPMRLSRAINLDPSMWDKVWQVIQRFFDNFDGKISQKRLLYELNKARELRQRRSRAGKNAITKRWSQPHDNENTIGIANEQQSNTKPTDPNQNQNQNQNQKRDPEGSAEGNQIARRPSASRLPRPAEPPRYHPEFEAFWARSRVGSKADAFKAWQQVGCPEASVLTAAWDNWSRVAWVDGFAVPHVATWLRRWDWKEQPVGVRPLSGAKGRSERTADALARFVAQAAEMAGADEGE